MKELQAICILVVLIATSAFGSNKPLAPLNLRVNYVADPVGIDDPTPRFSWEVADTDRGDVQTAYEIIVAFSLSDINSNNGDVWSSGKVVSSRQNGVVYNGSTLLSQKQYWWKVRTFDKDNQQSVWSNAASFETGLLNSSDWKASFLEGTFKLVRNEFTLPAGKTITKARAYVTSDGYFELRINGNKIGDHFLDPLPTETGKLLLYSTFDITSNLVNGSNNAVGIMLGGYALQKRSNSVKVICQIDIWFFDGTTQSIASNETWKVSSAGPVISQHIFDGENYDARAECTDWDNAGYNQSGWDTPIVTNNFPKGWTINNGVLEVRDGGEGLMTSNFSSSDYVIETDIKILQTCAGIIFRASNTDNLYMWQFNPGATGLRPHKRVGGTYSLVVPNIAISPALVLNQTYHVKIELKGSNIKSYIDGVLVSNLTDNTFLTGTIGFREALDEQCQFDNLKVTDNSLVVFFDDFTSLSDNWQKTNTLSLKSQLNPIKIDEVITPVAIYNPVAGTYVFDMGKNISGWAELNVQGIAGTKVTLRFAERIFQDKNINRTSTTNGLEAKATDTYILKGIGTEVWEPRFTYHGFRYVEVTGFPGTPTINSIKGKFFHSQVTNTVNEFSCSNPDLNNICKAYKLTQLDNLMGLPTDCNQRAERAGWLADAMVTSEAAMTYFDANSFYEKWMNDMLVNEIIGHGGALCIIPSGGGGDDVIWGSAVVSVPWDYYTMTGDSVFLSKMYPRCKRFVEWYKGLDANNNFLFEPDIEGLSESGSLMTAFQFNEWNPVGGNGDNLKPSKNFMGSLYYYRCANLLAKMAQTLGVTSDYNNYSALANNIKIAINSQFLKTSYYDNNKQTGNALAIEFGIVPLASYTAVINGFASDVNHNGDVQLKTGCLGTYALMRALGDNGLNDLAYKLAARKTYPSWGYMLNTTDAPGTFWEHWDNQNLSKNHIFLGGSVSTWLFHYVAGIKPLKPGYSEIQFKPDVTTQLDSASGIVYSVKGAIRSSWKKKNGELSWDITIPSNTSGILYIPTMGKKDAVKITEGSTILWDNTLKDTISGLKYLRTEGDFQVWSVGSGKYQIVVNDFFSSLSPFSKVSEETFGIWPNPAKNRITIDVQNHEAKSIQILDTEGKIIYSDNENYSGKKTINLSVSTGVYFVKVQGDVTFATQKLIVE